jgi:hypothetical protein
MAKIFELQEPSIQLFSNLKIKSLQLRYEKVLNEELKLENTDIVDTYLASSALATAMAQGS